MSKETRTIRPFRGLGALERVLRGVVLKFGPDSCQAGGSVTAELAPDEFLARPVTLVWGEAPGELAEFRRALEAGTQEMGLELDDLALIVVASTPYLKISEVLLSLPISRIDLLAGVTDLAGGGERPRAFCAPFNGFFVDTYLALARPRSPEPLRPHLRGTWLAREQFRVETTKGPALLPPTPLTDEVRSRLQLPAGVMRYIDFGDHDLLQPYGDQEAPTLYVDEKLLSRLNARRTAPASKAVQLQLVHDFVSAVVHRASKRADELRSMSYDDLRLTLLGSTIRLVAGPGARGPELNGILSLISERPEWVVARAEHSIDVMEGYTGALGDGEG